VHLVGYFYGYIAMHGFVNVKLTVVYQFFTVFWDTSKSSLKKPNFGVICCLHHHSIKYGKQVPPKTL